MNIAIGASPLCFARGGTERVAAGLAHAMLARGHNVHILAYDHGTPPVFKLDPRVNLKLMNADFSSGKNAEIALARQYLQTNDIDVFVSLQSEWTHMLWALSCLGSGIPFICSERSDPRFSEKVTWNRPGRHAVLASADAIHELLPAHVETIPEIHKHKVRVIPNAAPRAKLVANAGRADGIGVILFLARFIPGKRANLLIEAFAKLAPKFPGWRLRLAGYGPEEKNLRQLVNNLGIAEKTDFSLNPGDWQDECGKAQIYCLPTKVEGFPNSVLEAMSTGLPVVGMADCPAMEDIIRNGINGIIADQATSESLAESLASLMASPELRAEIGNNCLEQCSTIYESEQIWDQWQDFLEKIASRKGHTVMDTFSEEPFASMATLSSAARREYLYRNFGDPMPFSWPWFYMRFANFARNSWQYGRERFKDWIWLLGNQTSSLREAAFFAGRNSWRDLPYYFRQIEKTRRVASGRSLERTCAFGSFVKKNIGITGKRILCVGCGDSRELENFRSLGALVTGIDLHGAEGILAMNMEKMSFDDSTFDLTYACHSFEHCSDQGRAAAELMRVTAPGGHVAIEVPTNFSPGNVDLHSCLSQDKLIRIFSSFPGRVVCAGFFSRNDRQNGAGEDICRLIYQKR